MVKRRGLTILETVVAVGLLGALLTGCLRLLAVAAAQRRAADQRQCAIDELSNVMERVAARPWAELTADAVAGGKPSPAVVGPLAGATLRIDIAAAPGDPNAKRITVTLCWPTGANRPPAEARLSTWKYRINN